MHDDTIKSFKKFLSNFEESKTVLETCDKEIRFWRKRYFHEFCQNFDDNALHYIQNYLISLPATDFNLKSPEDHLLELLDSHGFSKDPLIKSCLSQDPDDEKQNPYFRFENDEWFFGVLLTTGKVLGFSSIHSYEKDYVLFNALDQESCNNFKAFGNLVCGAPSSGRPIVRVKIDAIVSLFELTDT